MQGESTVIIFQGNQTLLSPTICGLLSLALLSIGHFSGLQCIFSDEFHQSPLEQMTYNQSFCP